MFPENVLYEKENVSDLSTPGLVNVCVYVCVWRGARCF